MPSDSMSQELPRNVIVLIADSLRYDSVHNKQAPIGMPYVEANSVQYHEARSAGCWTLPATASIFTGLMPHEHGATSQTRSIHGHIPTLAENMQKAGYKTYQVTANIATTDIFGLHRGFDDVRRIWKHVDPKFNKIQQLLVLLGKPRLRKKIMSKDFLMQKMSSDLEMAKTWLQHTFQDVFDHCRKTIQENEKKGEKSFFFLNLMETHFPYHIAPTFKLSQNGLYKKSQEIISLFHLVNQTFLKKGEQNIKSEMLDALKQRQRIAWQSLAPHINAFAQEMHEETGNLFVFGADHGENFGETGWTYHFSNITDAGNKVPLFWLDHEQPSARIEDQKVSTRHLYHSLSRRVGQEMGGPDLVDAPDASDPVMSSYWYNNKGETLDQFKYNQICFLFDNNRYLLRNNEWFEAPMTSDYDEPVFTKLGRSDNPIFDLNLDRTRREQYARYVAEFGDFASKISFTV